MKLFFILSAAMVLLLSSCRTTKDISVNTAQSDSLYRARMEDSLKMLATYRENYEKMVQTFNETGVVFDPEPCPPIDSIYALLDSAGKIQYENILLREKIASVSNKLEVAADGSIKAEGRISSYKRTQQSLEREISNKDSTIEILQKKVSEQEAQLSTKQTEKIVHVKRSVFPGYWWFGLLVTLIGGWVLRSRLRLPPGQILPWNSQRQDNWTAK